MSFKSKEQAPPDNRLSRLRERLTMRAAGATLAALVGVGGVIAIDHLNDVVSKQGQEITALQGDRQQDEKRLTREAQILGALNDVAPDVVAGQTLKDPAKLSGVGMQVSAQNRQLQQGSSLDILERPKGTDSPWFNWCSANKVTVAGATYVSTAAHCFSDTTARTARPDVPSVYNILPDSSKEYALVAANDTRNVQAARAVLAHVTGISVETDLAEDWALMSVSTTGPDIEQRGGTSAFNTLPSLNIGQANVVQKPGQAVALYGMPQSNSFRPVAGTGEYLGEVTSGGQVLQLVGVDGAAHPNQDPCSFGASGSAAVFANGYVTGALSIRNNITFFPNGPDQNFPDDPAKYDITPRLGFEKQLSLDLSPFGTLCGFTLGGIGTAEYLAGGMNTPAPLEQSTPGMK